MNYFLCLFSLLVAILGLCHLYFKFLTRINNWFVQMYADKFMKSLQIIYIYINNATERSLLNVIDKEFNEVDKADHLLPMRQANLHFLFIGLIIGKFKLN